MKITLNEEQLEQLAEEQYLDIQLNNGSSLYFEFNKDLTFSYCEIINPKSTNRRKTYSFGTEELAKMDETIPYYPFSNIHNPQCPQCMTPLIYKFDYCPKCGQKIVYEKDINL